MSEEQQNVWTDEQCELMRTLGQWRDAGAPVSDVIEAIDALVDRRIEVALKGARIQLATTRS